MSPPRAQSSRKFEENEDLEAGLEEGEAGNDAGLCYPHAGAVQRSLQLKQTAIESLGGAARSRDTERYLHISKYGKPLPPWMVWEKQPALTRWNYYMSHLHTLMTDPSTGRAATYVSNFMVLTIITSVVSFCVETIPAFQPDRNHLASHVFTWIEAATIQIFTLDYLLRIVSAPNKLKFVVEPFNVIDLIAIIPWYIITWVGTDFNGTTVFRVVRLFRVFRVLKLGGRYSKLLVVLGALRKSLDMLGLMVFFVSLCIIFFSTLMYYAERGSYDAKLGYYVRPHEVALFDDGTPKPSPFESIVSGFWWAIVTLMTVGYGDVFPITAAGKFIACCAVMCGVLTLALPISVIGTTFSNDWAAHNEEEGKRRSSTNKHIRALAVTSPALLQLQRLLNEHIRNVDTLVDLNLNSELALDDTAAQLHHKLQAVKKQLHTEAKADLRLRKAAVRAKAARGRGRGGGGGGGDATDLTALLGPDDPPYDSQYGFLPPEHIRDRFRELLDVMQASSQQLSKRARHVLRMGRVDAGLLDPALAALVAALAKKHADLDFLLDKEKDRPDSIAELQLELRALQQYVQEEATVADDATRRPGEAQQPQPGADMDSAVS